MPSVRVSVLLTVGTLTVLGIFVLVRYRIGSILKLCYRRRFMIIDIHSRKEELEKRKRSQENSRGKKRKKGECHERKR